MHARGIPCAALLLLALAAAAPVHATTTVVPDSFLTIQAAIDSHRDTVFVRTGQYAEDLFLHSGVVLRPFPFPCCTGGEYVQVRGLGLLDVIPYSNSDVDVQGFRFSGGVGGGASGMWDYHHVTFEMCRLDYGLGLWGSVSDVSVRGCTILGNVSVYAVYAHFMQNSVRGGGVYLHAPAVFTACGNYVHGPAPFGIKGYSEGDARIESNTVVGCDIGIWGEADPTFVLDNVVTDCAGAGIYSPWGGADVGGNTVQRCGGFGIDFQGPHSLHVGVTNNRVLACQTGGIAMGRGDAALNTVGRCGGPGILVSYGTSGSHLSLNTAYANQGAGLAFAVPGTNWSVDHNIAFGNSGPGLLATGGSSPDLSCNDWYGNAGGMVSGAIPGATDVSVNPLFCNLPADDVHLSAGSPLLSLGSCGLVGALGQGCLVAAGVPPEGEPGIRAFTVSPNPSRGEVQFAWAGASRPEWVDVYDVTGARRWGQAIEPGASRLTWTGTDSEGRRLATGVYYARLTGRGVSANARFVLIR